ncbi:MAG: hypothetical protein IT454_15585 [Planctomycetes bacterium]|nr:hypothetical protein [Planctomycetota bacterium]
MVNTASIDPYGAPRVEVLPVRERRVWREGASVCAGPRSELPRRCVRCNEREAVRLERRLIWHDPWLYLLLFAVPALYLVVALFKRREARIEIGLCERHARSRRWSLRAAVCWALCVLGGCAALDGHRSPSATMLAVALLQIALLVGHRAANVLSAERIDGDGLRLAGADRRFLDALE